jgi:ectoine hydroxylase-related dioxygenase (phytanoyl-CoA dioxygenase family)
MSSTREPLPVQYKRDGFLVVESLLPSDLIGTLRERITDVGADRVPGFPQRDIEFEPSSDGGVSKTPRKINRCAENDSVFMSAACRNEILDIVEPLIGPDIKLFGSQCFMKPPGGVQKPYHQDSAYFTIEPLSLVTCWIALDEVTVDNGCMWVIPGSHADGIYDHSQPWEVAGRVDMQVPDGSVALSREVPITLSAGSCSFHHSVLLHRSGPNQTDSHRRGLAVHYMSSKSRWTHPSKAKPHYPLLRGREYEDCV